MIPELDCSEAEEAQIWACFESWSAPFRRRLREQGVPGLIERYRVLVEAVAPDGAGYYVYDYLNALSSREALQHLWELAPRGMSRHQAAIKAIDQRLRDCLVGDRFVFQEHARARHPPDPYFYYYGLPASVYGE